MMRKIFLIIILQLAQFAPAAAGTYSDFPLAQPSALKPFTRDLGGLMGSGTNQTARILGFAGFDVGVRAVTQLEPAKKNTILKKNRAFSLGWAQAEIGMPFRIDGFVRGGSYDGVSLVGGGLKYGLTKPLDEPYRVQAMIVAMGNMATHKYFYATHFASNLVFSVNVPYVAPYFGIGFDSTRLTVQTVTSDPALVGKVISAFEPRYTAGLRAKLNLGYISGGVTYTHAQTLVNAGVGLRF